MKYTVRKGLGHIIGNLARQMLLTQWPSIRPIAYSVGNKSTVVSAGSNVVEDMVEFGLAISSLNFKCDSMELGDVKCVELDSRVIKVSDLEQNGLQAIGDGEKEILHFVGEPVTVKIFFRCGYGSFSSYENRRFLEQNSLFENNVITMNSRHCDISTVGFTVEPVNDEEESLIINIDDSLGRNEHELVKESFNILFDLIENAVLF